MPSGEVFDSAARNRDEARKVALGRFLTSVLDKDPEAVESLLRKALNRVPESELSGQLRAELTISLAEALVFQRRLEEARDLARALLKEHPDFYKATVLDAQLAIKMGEPWPPAWRKLAQCWKTYETPIAPDRFWDGSPLNGRTILWAGEFGLGDQIQFVRFAPLLKEAGAGRVIVSANQRLLPLFQTLAGIDALVSPADLTLHSTRDSMPYDVAISWSGVPSELGITPGGHFGSMYPISIQLRDPSRLQGWQSDLLRK